MLTHQEMVQIAVRIPLQDIEDAIEAYRGFCFACQSFTTPECDLDSRAEECAECGELVVYGPEEVLLLSVQLMPCETLSYSSSMEL